MKDLSANCVMPDTVAEFLALTQVGDEGSLHFVRFCFADGNYRDVDVSMTGWKIKCIKPGTLSFNYIVKVNWATPVHIVRWSWHMNHQTIHNEIGDWPEVDTSRASLTVSCEGIASL